MKQTRTTSRRRWRIARLMAVWLAGCAGAVSAAPDISCFTTIAPAADLIERVGAGAVDVEVLVPSGQNPHTYSPKPRTMTQLARSQIFFAVGLPLEDRLIQKVRSTKANLEIIQLDRGIDKRIMGDKHKHEHEHEHEHEHGTEHGRAGDHGHHHGHGQGADPHIWLSPVNAGIMADTIAEALIEADPQRAKLYRRNLEQLQENLDEVHREIQQLLKPLKGKTFYVFHPAFGYFGDTYGLEERAVEISGRSPKPRELRSLIQQAKRDNVRVLFVQPQFDTDSARTIARAINGSVVPLDPLDEDLLENFRTIARNLRESLADD